MFPSKLFFFFIPLILACDEIPEGFYLGEVEASYDPAGIVGTVYQNGKNKGDKLFIHLDWESVRAAEPLDSLMVDPLKKESQISLYYSEIAFDGEFPWWTITADGRVAFKAKLEASKRLSTFGHYWWRSSSLERSFLVVNERVGNAYRMYTVLDSNNQAQASAAISWPEELFDGTDEEITQASALLEIFDSQHLLQAYFPKRANLTDECQPPVAQISYRNEVFVASRGYYGLTPQTSSPLSFYDYRSKMLMRYNMASNTINGSSYEVEKHSFWELPEISFASHLHWSVPMVILCTYISIL